MSTMSLCFQTWCRMAYLVNFDFIAFGRVGLAKISHIRARQESTKLYLKTMVSKTSSLQKHQQSSIYTDAILVFKTIVPKQITAFRIYHAMRMTQHPNTKTWRGMLLGIIVQIFCLGQPPKEIYLHLKWFDQNMHFNFFVCVCVCTPLVARGLWFGFLHEQMSEHVGKTRFCPLKTKVDAEKKHPAASSSMNHFPLGQKPWVCPG